MLENQQEMTLDIKHLIEGHHACDHNIGADPIQFRLAFLEFYRENAVGLP